MFGVENIFDDRQLAQLNFQLEEQSCELAAVKKLCDEMRDELSRARARARA